MDFSSSSFPRFAHLAWKERPRATILFVLYVRAFARWNTNGLKVLSRKVFEHFEIERRTCSIESTSNGFCISKSFALLRKWMAYCDEAIVLAAVCLLPDFHQ